LVLPPGCLLVWVGLPGHAQDSPGGFLCVSVLYYHCVRSVVPL